MGAVGGVHSKAGSGSRGRPFAIMLLLAFGAALLGVMLLHKFRERRICNLLLKRTDQDLHSFQLLFQRERDRNKELEKNNEDMKATLYSLRTQKMELDRRLLELHSTIDSLRDEQKTINVTLQEQQNEIKMLREKEIESGNENPQVVALTQSLKQKDAELENLRRRLESRGAVATDDPSDSRGHSTMSEVQNEQLLESSGGKGGENESRDNSRGESNSTDFSEGSTSRRDEIGTQESDEAPERRETKGDVRQKQESLEDEGEKQEVMDGDVRKVDGEESKITKDHEEEEVKDSQAVENHRAHKILKSRKKMETESGKYAHTSKIKGKRWRYIARKRTLDNGWRLISKKRKQENNRNLDDGGIISTRHRKFFKGGASIEEETKEEYPMEARENQMENESKMLKQEELNSTKGDILSEDGEQNGEVGDGSIEQNPGEQMELKGSKSEEKQEQEGDADGSFNRESNSDVKEEEENKEETESEF